MPSLASNHAQSRVDDSCQPHSTAQATGQPATAPLRVLQVVGNLDRGGIETWLMHLLRRWDRGQIAMDFLIHSPQPGHYAAEAEALGSQGAP
ncbi:MAG: glycosyltransferase family 1 protein, partial [Synechococcales cyanobacterium CRU_2_2]|nr:glycosyltransferase family 1 protein [Synechococcales cyanobacterium CRU_2_2]